MWKDVAMAALYYMPFVVTIAFAAFVFVVGFVALLSGTLVVLVLATYGAYSLMRDAGAVDKAYEWMKAMWNFPDSVVVTNLKKSFVLEGLDTIPKGNALYICHPHGMVGYSWFFHFAFRLSEWSAGGPRPLLAMHSILFRIPFARDLLAANRCIEASEDVIRRQLEAGESVAIVLGGVEEMTLAGQERVKLVVKKRKGYSRIARQLGIPIVPVYSEGENELFPAEQNSLWKFTSLWMYKLFKLQLSLIHI